MVRFIAGPLGSFGVDGAAGELGERFIRLLLLGQGLVDEFDGVLHAQLGCQGFQRAVTGNFVVLDSLSRGEQSRIESGRVTVLFNYLLSFIDDTLDSIALFAARRLTSARRSARAARFGFRSRRSAFRTRRAIDLRRPPWPPSAVPCRSAFRLVDVLQSIKEEGTEIFLGHASHQDCRLLCSPQREHHNQAPIFRPSSLAVLAAHVSTGAGFLTDGRGATPSFGHVCG